MTAGREGVFQLRTSVIVNDTIIPLNGFTQNYIGNVLRSIAVSLGHPSKAVAVHIDRTGLCIYTEEGELPLLKDFAGLLVENTVKGLISSLRGVSWFQSLTVTTEAVSEELTGQEHGPYG